MGRTLVRAGLLGLAVSAVFVFAATRPAREANACGAYGPFDFDTYESDKHETDYARAIELSVEGKGVTFAYNVSGEAVDVRYQGLETGTRQARAAASPAYRIPPSVYKSIVWVESNWSHGKTGSTGVPWGGAGPVLRSFDCGFGLGQVTSGMYNNSGTATAKQAVVASHFLFNLAEGVRILADKWNTAPNYRPIAGNGDPGALEDWYYAIWSYNGFAFSNHPLNPSRNPLRGDVYHCYEPTAPSYQESGGDVVFGYGSYTYPERVYGCMRFPPKDDQGEYSPPPATGDNPPPAGVKFNIGDTAIVTTTGCMNLRAVPTTAGNTPIACLVPGAQGTVLAGPVDADGYRWWQIQTPEHTGWGAETFLSRKSTATGLTGKRLWAPQVFDMPHFEVESVASAFAPGNFLACEDAGFGGGCPAMDYPTSLPDLGIVTHPDTTPAIAPEVAYKFLGDPQLVYDGPTALELVAKSDGTSTTGTIVVSNKGTFVGPFRIRASAPWVHVRHPGDSSDVTLDGSVAIGKEIAVVLRGGAKQAGWNSTLVVSLDVANMPPGANSATLWLEPLLGSGGVFTVYITATNVPGGPGDPPGPTNRVVAPNISTDH